jgi:hypothetical protein
MNKLHLLTLQTFSPNFSFKKKSPPYQRGLGGCIKRNTKERKSSIIKKRRGIFSLIFILLVALINIANAATDDPKFHNLTSTLLVQQTLANTENTIPNSEWQFTEGKLLSLRSISEANRSPNSEQPLPSILKSPSKAFLFSAFIPGTGEIYAEAKRGYLYIATEIGLFAGYFLVRRNASSLRDDYVQQVRDHVKFDTEVPHGIATDFSTWNMEDFEHSTMYDNWRGYAYTDNNPESDIGEPIERIGKFYWDDIPETTKNQKREPPDSQNRQVALGLREDSNSRFKLAKTFLGLVIFNHLASAIDARITAKLYNKRLISEKSELSFKTTILPDLVESRFEFHRRF